MSDRVGQDTNKMVSVLPLELQADIQQHSLEAMKQERQQARIDHYNVLRRERLRRVRMLESLSADPQQQVQRTGTRPNDIGQPSRVLMMHGAPSGPEEQWTQEALRTSVTTITRTLEAQAAIISKYQFKPIVEDTVHDATSQPDEASGDEDLPDAAGGQLVLTDEMIRAHPLYCGPGRSTTSSEDSEAGVEAAARALETLQANPTKILRDTDLRRWLS